MSEELNFKRKSYDIVEAYLNCKKMLFNIYEKEYENQFNDYRDENVEEKENIINEKFSKLPILQLIKQIKLAEILWDFDGVSFIQVLCGMKNHYLPRNETGYAFLKDKNDEFVQKFSTGNFNLVSAILKIKYFESKKFNRSTSSG